MRNNKRALALILASSLMVGSFAGCSNRSDDEGDTSKVIIYSTDESEDETEEGAVTDTEAQSETEKETTKAPKETTEKSTTEKETTEKSTTEKATDETTKETTKETTTEEPPTTTAKPSEIGLTAVAQVENYVNVRMEPNTSSEILGKIYNNCAAVILDEMDCEDGEWYYMTSGNCTGYIKAEFFVTGAEAEALRETIGITKARVREDYTRVRTTPTLDTLDNVITMYRTDTIVAVVGVEGEFVKIETDAASTGFVHMSCLDIYKEFDVALTIEEEEAIIAEQQRREEEARRAYEEYLAQLAYESSVAESESIAVSMYESALQVQYEQSVAASLAQQQAEYEAYIQASIAQSKAAYDASVLASMQQATQAPTDPNAALRNAIVAFAMQFVGRPYVHGGRSLYTGTDCSGFTNLVYQNFGYNLSWTVEGSAVLGTRLPYTQALPGDLLFYANSTSPMGHVAMYIGNGQIVHAASPAFGVCVWNMMYREPLFAVRIVP